MTKTICLVGNPNVGKSTIFNALTGLKQHTGNWAGKTVGIMQGNTTYKNEEFTFIDLPGTYSLKYSSAEEQIATDYIKSEKYDVAVVICDATSLKRSLNLVLQTLELTNKVIVCVNLVDEALKKGIFIESKKLENILKVPVILTSARNKKGLDNLEEAIKNFSEKETYLPKYHPLIEEQLVNLNKKERLDTLEKMSLESNLVKDEIIKDLDKNTKEIFNQVVIFKNRNYEEKERKLDKILTSKKTGIPIMILTLFVILWITIFFSNIPSEMLFNFFRFLEPKLTSLFNFWHLPKFFNDLLVLGIYRTLTWVIAVMLPPMAIFFPLFTILEDYGFLPRLAFNIDKVFQKCQACGKQCLTMLMGFGCNAVGVTGSRIIESKRERLMAILTNVFVPCNGRFPTLIAIISMFFIKTTNSFTSTMGSALILTLIITFSFIITFLVSYFLSKTFLKGLPSFFILELPPFRKPKFLSVIIHSIFDKTLHILGRAIIVAIPAGVILFLLGNIFINNQSMLIILSGFLQKFGLLIGLDGVILVAFLLSFPANEIVIPIMLMGYLASGSLVEYESLESLKNILITNGWTFLTALNFLIITLLHYPCSTTILTIKKEIGSLKWTLLAIVLPIIISFSLCFITTLIAHFL